MARNFTPRVAANIHHPLRSESDQQTVDFAVFRFVCHGRVTMFLLRHAAEHTNEKGWSTTRAPKFAPRAEGEQNPTREPPRCAPMDSQYPASLQLRLGAALPQRGHKSSPASPGFHFTRRHPIQCRGGCWCCTGRGCCPLLVEGGFGGQSHVPGLNWNVSSCGSLPLSRPGGVRGGRLSSPSAGNGMFRKPLAVRLNPSKEKNPLAECPIESSSCRLSKNDARLLSDGAARRLRGGGGICKFTGVRPAGAA